MTSVKHMQPGLAGLDPGAAIQGSPVNMEDVHIGIEHGPSGTMYNRAAFDWEGASYSQVNGSWVKVAGRSNALSGSALERKYPGLTSRWESFGSAQSRRPSGEGAANMDWDTLMEQVTEAAAS